MKFYTITGEGYDLFHVWLAIEFQNINSEMIMSILFVALAIFFVNILKV